MSYQYWIIIVATLLVYVIMNWDVNDDYKKIKQNLGINHENEAWIRCALLTPSVIGYTIALSPSGLIEIFLCLILSCLLILFYYATIFDGLLNNKRDYNWWFTGSPGPEDGRIERFLHRLIKWQIILIKIGGCLFFTLIYILCFKNS